MGGKDDAPVIGYHYRVAYHAGLCRGPIDAFLEFRAADKVAWDGGEVKYNASGGPLKYIDGKLVKGEIIPATGPLLASGRIQIGKPNLFGGEKDQGGITGPVDVMFGEADQLPNAYLREIFGEQTVAWRGVTTLAFCGGRFGAMNPMPQKPSYKIQKIYAGWDGDWGEDLCWYPETAAISQGGLRSSTPDWRYMVVDYDDHTDYSSPAVNDSSWAIGPAPFGSHTFPAWFTPKPSESGFSDAPSTIVPVETAVWMRTTFYIAGTPDAFLFDGFADNGIKVWVNGALAIDSFSDIPHAVSRVIPAHFFQPGLNHIAVRGTDLVPPPDPSQNWFYFDVRLTSTRGGVQTMNPAHALYYVRTDSEKGREPYANINDASLRAAADRLYAEAFGLCWQYDPKQDTPDAWCDHICRIIGGSFTRSLVDGQWYLDLARGDYDIDSLPVIGDDDILDFKELPTTLDRAVNSVSVRYFDPERNEKIITPAVRALGLIRMFGEIHQTLDFPEVPTGELALRIAERELRAYITPTRTFELATTPRTRGIRNNQYFRLQSPRRGIADMVCIMGEQDSGTLRSGGLRRKVSQDVYALPSTSYVDIEPGVDTRPPQNPLQVSTARVFEAPYFVLARTVSRAELPLVEDDAGYLLAVAADPGEHLDYRVAVAPTGDDYLAGGTGRWCATALIVDAAGYLDTGFTFASGRHLDNARVGAPVLWGDELCRLDAIDPVAGTIALGRGCADTVRHKHAAGERIWILTEVARGAGEYSDGEEVDVKLLSRTATAELPLDAAPVLALEFAGRQARPYPPAAATVNGVAYPIYLYGELSMEWAHRDRVQQADQLVDQTLASIGPEPGTTYTVRWFLDNVLEHSEDGITGTIATHTPGAAGVVRIEIESERDGLVSWQMQVRSFSWTPSELSLLTIMDVPVTILGEPIFMQE